MRAAAAAAAAGLAVAAAYAPAAPSPRRAPHVRSSGDEAPDLAVPTQSLEELEAEYWNSLDEKERVILQKSRAGGAYLRNGQLGEALACFDVAQDLSENTRYEWHRGLCLYYLDKLPEARDDFVANAARFEARFASPATEERLFAVAAARRLGAAEPDVRADDLRESRPALRAAADLFAGDAAAGPALRTLCALDDGADKLRRRLFGHFYAGLYHEARGDDDRARAHVALAFRRASCGPDDDLAAALPRLHADARGWSLAGVPDAALRAAEAFDGLGGGPGLVAAADEAVVAALSREDVDAMTVVNLKAALLARGMKRTGLKRDLKARLLEALGLAP